MIAVLKSGVTHEQIDNLIEWFKSQGLKVHLSEGDYKTILGLIGDTTKIDIDLLKGLDIIAPSNSPHLSHLPANRGRADKSQTQSSALISPQSESSSNFLESRGFSANDFTNVLIFIVGLW